jgi:hypothetical protein
MPKDRANDPKRVSDYQESRQDYMERKFGYELAHPQPDTHEAEYEDANRHL